MSPTAYGYGRLHADPLPLPNVDLRTTGCMSPEPDAGKADQVTACGIAMQTATTDGTLGSMVICLGGTSLHDHPSWAHRGASDSWKLRFSKAVGFHRAVCRTSPNLAVACISWRQQGFGCKASAYSEMLPKSSMSIRKRRNSSSISSYSVKSTLLLKVNTPYPSTHVPPAPDLVSPCFRTCMSADDDIPPSNQQSPWPHTSTTLT